MAIPPVVVVHAFLAPLEGVDREVEEDRRAKRGERLAPDVDAGGFLDHEVDLQPLVAHGQQVAVVAEVEELLALAGALAGEVDRSGRSRRDGPCRFVSPAWWPSSSFSLMSGSPAAASSVGSQSSPAKMSVKTVPGLTVPGQRTSAGTRQPPSQLVFFSPRNGVVPASGNRQTIGPLSVGVEDDRVVGQAQPVHLVEQLADQRVVLDHAVGVEAQPGLAPVLLLHVREVVHPGGVEPAEERLARFLGPAEEVGRRREDFLVDRLHPLLGQRAGVLDLAVRRWP